VSIIKVLFIDLAYIDRSILKLYFATKYKILILIHIMLCDHREFLQREHKEIMKQNDSDVHKEPLKTDGSSINTGLERSYSSPNLLQVRRIPRYNLIINPFFFVYLFKIAIA